MNPPKVITKIKVIKQEIPNEYLQCDDLPLVPTVKMQSEVASFVTKLYEVADSCKENMEKAREYVDGK